MWCTVFVGAFCCQISHHDDIRRKSDSPQTSDGAPPPQQWLCQHTHARTHTHTCAHTHTSVPVVIHSRIFFFTLWLTHSFQALRFLGTLLIKMRVEYFTCCRFPSCSSLSSDLRKDTAIDTATRRWCGSTVFIRPRPSQTQKVCMWVLRSAYLRLSSMLLVIAGLSLSSSNECWDCGRSLR